MHKAPFLHLGGRRQTNPHPFSAMLIDQVFLYFLIAVGVVVSLPALWLLMRARWPQRVEKLREVSGRSVILSFIAGLPLLPAMAGIVVLLARFGKRGDIVLAFVVGFGGLLLALSALAGIAGLATLIGERLSSANSTAEPWRTTLRGGIVMVCLVSMPYVGWFALLPICIIIGGGMMLRSFFVRTARPVPSMAAAQAPPSLPSQAPAQTA